MPVYYDPGVGDDAIRALLAGGTAAALATGGIFDDGLIHDGADVPYVVWQPVTDQPAHALGGHQRHATISYLVRCVAETVAEARALAAAVDADLHAAQPTIAGYTVLSLLAEGGGSRYPDGDGFYNVAAYYRLRLEKAN